ARGAAADRVLRVHHDDGGHRVLHPEDDDRAIAGSRVVAAGRARLGHEGQGVGGDLRRRDAGLVRAAVDRDRVVRRGGADLAGARSPHRAARARARVTSLPGKGQRAGAWGCGPGKGMESGMPFKSQAQRRKFAQLLVEGKISPETYEEWNRETGSAKLP